MDKIWDDIQALDVHIQKTEPWKKIKTDETTAKKTFNSLLTNLHV